MARRAFLAALLLYATDSWAANHGTRLIGSAGVDDYVIGFCDPLDSIPTFPYCQETGLPGGSGDAFDREYIAIAVNPQKTNSFLAETIPAAAVGSLELSFGVSGVASGDPLRPSKTPQLVTLSGIAPGITTLEAPGSRTPSAGVNFVPLNTYVFPPISASVAFHLVSDTNGVNSGLNPQDISEILNEVNSIWGQVNVSFSQASPVDGTTMTFSTKLMPILDADGLATSQALDIMLASDVDRSASFHVFLFHSATGGDLGLTIAEPADAHCDGHFPAAASANSVVATFTASDDMKKSNQEIATTVAHELGHALGLRSGSTWGKFVFDGVHSIDSAYSYQLMAYSPIPFFEGRTVTPPQRDCISRALTPP